MRLFEPQPGWRLLDFGAYLGANLLHYAERGFDIRGVEGARGCVDDYYERVRDVDSPPKMHHCLIEEFEPGEERWDAVICCEVLQYVETPRDIFRKANECLRPDGKLFLSVPQTAASGHRRGITSNILLDWYRDTGFEPTVIVGIEAPPSVGCVDQIVAGGYKA